MKLTQQEIDSRLHELMKVIEWVMTDVTSSFEEKARAAADSGVVGTWIAFNNRGTLEKVSVLKANELYESYSANLTGSNVPKGLRPIG